MLDGINDSTDHARKLVHLLRDIPAKVNLIPFNSVEGIAYDCSPKLVIDRFREEVLAGGLMTITRRTRGADIAAACGQLAGEVRDRTSRSARYALGGDSR
jgi:23S rRNA (adenine2503-C2)-methyltransferase